MPEPLPGEQAAAQVSVLKLSLGIVAITIPPIIFGMLVKAKFPNFAQKTDRFVRFGTIIFLATLAIIASYRERQIIADNYAELTLIAIAVCLLSALMGTVFGGLFRLSKRHVLTLAIEVGLHNSAMGIVIALSFLNMPALAVFSAFYLLVEYALSGILMSVMNSPVGSRFIPITQRR